MEKTKEAAVIQAEKARKWAESPEGQKALIEAAKAAQKSIDKLNAMFEPHHCDCCYCRNTRPIGTG
ncbi:hypothetical protein KAR91_46525 [Candidatus Pacearchaeota archaeon]|nr:hypothetical protein [Candidatus Pacearchaeota archaeon]